MFDANVCLFHYKRWRDGAGSIIFPYLAIQLFLLETAKYTFYTNTSNTFYTNTNNTFYNKHNLLKYKVHILQKYNIHIILKCKVNILHKYKYSFYPNTK